MYFIIWFLIQYIVLVHSLNTYLIKIERAEVIHNDRNFIDFSMECFMMNRTFRALNMTWIVTRDWPQNIQVHIKAYEFLSNEYRQFAIDFNKNFCDYLQAEYLLIFYKDYNNEYSHPIPPKCPLKKGVYTVRNYAPHAKNIPVSLPFKKAMIEYTFYYNKKKINHYQIFFFIDHDNYYREAYG